MAGRAPVPHGGCRDQTAALTGWVLRSRQPAAGAWRWRPGSSEHLTLAAAQVTAGADLGGSVAAALAAASMLLRPEDAAYADTLLAAAQKAYQFAQNSNRVKCGAPPVGARWRLRAGLQCTARRWPGYCSPSQAPAHRALVPCPPSPTLEQPSESPHSAVAHYQRRASHVCNPVPSCFAHVKRSHKPLACAPRYTCALATRRIAVFYGSYSVADDLAWGAMWLYKATGQQTWLDTVRLTITLAGRGAPQRRRPCSRPARACSPADPMLRSGMRPGSALGPLCGRAPRAAAD